MRFLPIVVALLAAACVNVAPSSTALPVSSPTQPPTSAAATPQPTTAPPTTAPTTAPTPTSAPTATPSFPSTTLPPLPTATTAAQSPGPSPEPVESTSAEHEKIQVGDYQYVTMADAEWSQSGYRDFFEPAEGNVLYAFLMEFEGIDPEGSSYNPLYFKLTADGSEGSWYLFGKEPELGSGDLAAGDTVQGWLTFEAPLVDSVVLRYDPVGGLVGEPVEWTVTVNP